MGRLVLYHLTALEQTVSFPYSRFKLTEYGVACYLMYETYTVAAVVLFVLSMKISNLFRCPRPDVLLFIHGGRGRLAPFLFSFTILLEMIVFRRTRHFTQKGNGFMTAILITLALLLLLLGLLGAVHPVLPGMPLMFGGLLLLAYAQDFQVIGATALWVLGIVLALAAAGDYVAGLLGAKFSGASKEALWAALAGGFIGLFFSLPGMILGPLIGAAAGEFWARRSLLAAGKVGLGTFVGFLLGVVVKLGCALVVLFSILGLYVAHWLS